MSCFVWMELEMGSVLLDPRHSTLNMGRAGYPSQARPFLVLLVCRHKDISPETIQIPARI